MTANGNEAVNISQLKMFAESLSSIGESESDPVFFTSSTVATSEGGFKANGWTLKTISKYGNNIWVNGWCTNKRLHIKYIESMVTIGLKNLNEEFLTIDAPGEIISYVTAGSGYSGYYMNSSGGSTSLYLWKNSDTQCSYKTESGKYIEQYQTVLINDDFFVKSS